MPQLDARARVDCALAHREPDRVPIDGGATGFTGFRVEAHDRLLDHLRIDDRTQSVANDIQRLASPHEALIERYDLALALLRPSDGSFIPPDDYGDARYEWRTKSFQSSASGADARTQTFERVEDDWGVVWRRESAEPHYTIERSPLSGPVSVDHATAFRLPDPEDPLRWLGTPTRDGRVSVVRGLGGGVLETALRLRGASDVLRDLATGSGPTASILERVSETKSRYWETRLADPLLSDLEPLIVAESERLEIVPGLPLDDAEVEDLLVPFWRDVLGAIRRIRADAHIALFCPSYRHEVLPLLIREGVRVVGLAPRSATQVDDRYLKREYGDSLTFVGATTTEPEVFLLGTEENAQDAVKRTLDAFAPGGGLIWSPCPIVEASVPPVNMAAALDMLTEYGIY
ncbi:hypothetical protein FJZ36_03265 [Candidatus Poribacteria bacterium]|nr:hypothetical protein [Candidatus Poribacteria bacterium]